MAVTRTSHYFQNLSTTNTYSILSSRAPTAGRLTLAFLHTRGNLNNLSAYPSGFTELLKIPVAGATCGLWVGYKYKTAAEPRTWVWRLSTGSFSNTGCTIMQFTGECAAFPISQYVGQGSNSTSYIPIRAPDLRLYHAGNMSIFYCAYNSSTGAGGFYIPTTGTVSLTDYWNYTKINGGNWSNYSHWLGQWSIDVEVENTVDLEPTVDPRGPIRLVGTYGNQGAMVGCIGAEIQINADDTD